MAPPGCDALALDEFGLRKLRAPRRFWIHRLTLRVANSASDRPSRFALASDFCPDKKVNKKAGERECQLPIPEEMMMNDLELDDHPMPGPQKGQKPSFPMSKEAINLMHDSVMKGVWTEKSTKMSFQMLFQHQCEGCSCGMCR